MEKDNKKPAPKEAAPPTPKKVATPAPVSKKKPVEKPKKPVKHEAKGKTPNGDPAEEINVKPTTEENASLLGRLRRAIGENTRPYGPPKPRGKLTNYPQRGTTPSPVEKKSLNKPPLPKARNAPPRDSFGEEVEQTNEAVLTLSQRIKRAQIMRREAPKIERAREISRTRFAREDQLKNRAEVLARRLVKKKFAGQRGYDYQKLSTSEKMSIDAMVDKKVDLIHRLAKRLFPVVKRKEVARMLALHTGINATPGAAPVNIVNSYDPGTEIVEKKLRKVPKDPTTGGPAKYYEGLTKSEKLKRAAQFAKQTDLPPEMAEPAPGDAEAETKPSKFTNAYHARYSKKSKKMNEQISGLKKKAEKSGISYGTLKKVYDRGMAAWRTGHRPGTTPQQWAFARVNSYITKGKGTYHGADKDLREDHMPSCDVPPPKKTLLKRMKRIKNIKEAQRVADSRMVKYIDPITGLEKERNYRRPTAVNTGEGGL